MASIHHIPHAERRAFPRFDHHSIIKFVFEDKRSEKLNSALTQDASTKGFQILASQLLTASQRLEVYLPIENKIIIPAIADVMWSDIETELGDSPYWLRGGLHLHFFDNKHKKLVRDFLFAKKAIPIA